MKLAHKVRAGELYTVNRILQHLDKMLKLSKPDVGLKVLLRRLNIGKYPLTVFFLVLAVRLVPEFLMGPYPLGFDTVAYYLPNTILWIGGKIDFWQGIAMDPLLYAILAVTPSGFPMTLAFKIVPSLLHGFLALTIYIYSSKGLNWSPIKSLFTSLLASLYFVSLRISWDQLRMELGLIFTFLALTLLYAFNRTRERRKGHYTFLSLTIALASLAYPLSAFLVLLIALVTHLTLIKGKDYAKARDLTAIVIPAVMIFTVNIFSRLIISSRLPIVSSFAPSAPLSYQDTVSNTLGLIAYCYLPLFFFAAIGIPYIKSLHIRVWIIWSLVTMISPVLRPIAHIPGDYRWIYMLAFPLTILTVEGFARLRLRLPSRRKLLTFTAIAISFTLIVSSLTVGFITQPPERPFPYFDSQKYNQYIFFIPSSMLQNTVSITDTNDVVKTVNWLSLNMGSESTLLLPSQFYGWVVASIGENERMVYFGEISPFNFVGVQSLLNESWEALNDGESKIYTIWWTPGLGWYGAKSLPSEFVEVQRFGNISAYVYAETGIIGEAS